GTHSYAVELSGEQRQEIMDKKGYTAEPQVRRFLQRIVDNMLPEILGEKK
ncbi:unnamed protein product, partial [marine sediment metagenome]